MNIAERTKRAGLLVVLFCATALGQSDLSYAPSDEIIRNPERGWYSELVSQAEQSPFLPPAAEGLKIRGQSLVMRMYYLKTFRDRPLSDAELTLVRNDLGVIRQAGMKGILRFAYSENIGQPDAPLGTVLQHIAQLKPVLQENADIIAVMQAGFIGAWGEWHSSSNGLDTVTNRQKILFALLGALPADRMVQVRTPHYKREIFGRSAPIARSEAFNESPVSRVGHHNDCFLANWNDYGTYADTVEEENFLSAECRYVPMGGETCNPSSYAECVNAVRQMTKLRWSYLNSGYHHAVLDGWSKNGCFDVIAKRLGYRFQLLRGVFDDSVNPGGGFRYNIRLTNTGFAAAFNPRDVELILRDPAGKTGYVVKLPDDPRFWQPGDTVSLSGEAGVPDDIPQGTYTVYLNLPDPAHRLRNRPEYSIRCANENVWDQHTGYNRLKAALVTRPGKARGPYTGLYYFTTLVGPEGAE